MKRLKSIVLAACAVFVAGLLLLPTPASAQSSASLSITPKKNYTIEPGRTINDTITIRNLDAERSLDLSLRIVDFTFMDDGGAPQLFLAEDAPQTTWSLKPFMTTAQSVSIAPRSSETVPISVSIPEGQGAGSFYSAILYSAGAPEGGNVGLSASGVTLVFTTIPGIVDEKLTLEQFGAYNTGTNGEEPGYKLLATSEPTVIAYTLKNEGNVTEAPVGSIKLKYMFGKEYNITNVNPNESLALIGQTRTFTSCIKLQSEDIDFNGTRAEATQCASPGLWPGLYTADIDLFYGQNGNRTQEIISSAWFWYLPWWFIIAFFVVLLIIAYFVWRIVRAVRQRLYGSHRRRSPQRRRR